MRPALVLIGLAIGLTILGAGGCVERDILAPGEERAILIGAAVQGADSIYVSLGLAAVGRPNRPIRGAEPILRRGGGDGAFTEVEAARCRGPLGFACYAVASGPVLESGEVVGLSGTIRQGGPWTASTIVPGPPPVSLDGAGPGDTLRLASITTAPPPVLTLEPGEGVLVLHGDPGAEVTVHAGQEVHTCSTGFGLPTGVDLRARVEGGSGPLELPLSLPNTCGGEPREAWDSLSVEFTVLSYDANLSEWLRTGPNVFEPSRFGVEGVDGAFGSASVRTFVVTGTLR